MKKTMAEQAVEEFHDMIKGWDDTYPEVKVEIKDGIVTARYLDGSYLDFTEPRAFQAEG